MVRKEDVEEDKTQVKPWVFARASFHVKPAEKGVRNRCKKLKMDREALGRGISRAPYVSVRIGQNQTRALVDTGADWSLLDYSLLSKVERDNLGTCEAAGQGVSREPINIIGEVWRDVEAGGIGIAGQRFIVVRNMVTDAILGAAFWVRSFL